MISPGGNSGGTDKDDDGLGYGFGGRNMPIALLVCQTTEQLSLLLRIFGANSGSAEARCHVGTSPNAN
jgi:hypothetical protein